MAADWEAYVDESGYTYYYNPITGETAWEIPPDDNVPAHDEWQPSISDDVPASTDAVAIQTPLATDPGAGEWAFGGVSPDDGTFFFIHTRTGERVTNLPMSLAEATTPQPGPATAAAALVHDAVDPDVQACMDDLVQTIETKLVVWMRRRQRNAKALAKQSQRTKVLKKQGGASPGKAADVQPNDHLAPAGRMHEVLRNAKRYEYSAEYAARRAELNAQLREDEVEKEVLRVKDRFAVRRKHQVKQAAAWRRADFKQEQIQLRHHITRVLIAKATNGLDIHGKIDLTSGDGDNRGQLQPGAQRRDEFFESEERAALARHRTRQLERLFVAIDTDKRGAVSALHVLHQLATQPNIVQRWVQPPRPGLQNLLTTGELQAFFLQLGRVNLRQFVHFVEISEDVVAQVDRIKAAMEKAGLGVVSADVATWQSSMFNVKMGEPSSRKLVVVNRMQQSFQLAKDNCEAQLRHVMHFRHPGLAPEPPATSNAPQSPPIWQLAHKHVYLQLQPSLPSYCVHCRRCRARLEKLDRYESEARHRATWGRYLARRMHDIEMSLRQWPTHASADEADLTSITPLLAASEEPAPTVEPQTSSRTVGREQEAATTAVAAALRDVVTGATLLARYNAWESRVLAPTPPPSHHRKQSAATPATSSATPATSPSKGSHDLLTKLTKRREDVEREEMTRALMFEEDERTREEVECAKVGIEIPLVLEQEAARREFVRLLQACLDPSMALKRLNFERVLAIRSPTDNMVLRMVDSATNTHCIVHTIRCASVDEADIIVLVARQLQHHHPPNTVQVLHVFQYMYQQFAANGNLNECWPIVFVVTEDCMEGGHWLPPAPRPPLPPAEILHILNAVSAALAALHSQHICHWNLNARNLYKSNGASKGGVAVDRPQQLRLGGFLAFKQPFAHDDLSKSPSLVHPSLAPPELSAARNGNGIAMLDEKTDMWMLGCLLYSLLTGSEQNVREKSLSTIMTDIPLRYGTSLRSCLRMLLQPQPQHRPTAMEIFNFISCASPDEGATADPHPPLTMKKSVPSLDPLPPR